MSNFVYRVYYYSDADFNNLLDTQTVWNKTYRPSATDKFHVRSVTPLRDATGDSVTVTYKPGADTLGLSWTKSETVYQNYSPTRWSNEKLVPGSDVEINTLYWAVEKPHDDGVGCDYQLKCHRVELDKSIGLTCPASYSWNGFYGDANRTYLTINDGFDTEKKISLDSQVKHVVEMDTWDSVNDLTKTMEPGSTYYIGYIEGTITVRGTRTHLYHTKRSDAKTYKQLIKDKIDLTSKKQESVCNVKLTSEHQTFHSDELLEVLGATEYQFNCWKTTSDAPTESNKLNLEAVVPWQENLTIYADWKISNQSTKSTFPQWSTSELLPCGTDPVRTITVNCYSKDLNVPYHVITLGEYESKQAIHSKWTDGTNVFDIGAAIPFQDSATYTAVWVVDDTADAIYSIPNNLVQIPHPPQRAGFTYIGLAENSESNTPMYLPEDKILIEDDVNLFAIWKANGGVKILNGNTFKTYQIYIFNGTEWELYIPKVYKSGAWKDCT